MARRKNPAAVQLGRKGGKNSRKNLSPEKKTELAKRAAAARWGKTEEESQAPQSNSGPVSHTPPTPEKQNSKSWKTGARS
jgi:hypothetical protein